MNKNLPLHPNSSYYQMCISKRQKSDIIIINIIRQPKPVSLDHAEIKKYIFLFRYLFC